jgi:type I restriction enzyme, R subunit
MSKQSNEHAFESYVEEILSTRAGWRRLDKSAWDQSRALFPSEVVAFLRETQPTLWSEMELLHGGGLEPLLITTLTKELDSKGALHVLRHGFKFYGKTFRLAHFKPSQGANFDALDQFRKNRLTVARQIPCHPANNCTADLILAINGLPVSTIELKNPTTGQTWRHAVRQYREDRDPRSPLFDFKKRALVHFAADPDEVHMTTRLAGEKTFFLPFNRGSNPGEIVCGAGNPSHPSGYRTGYFWEEVLQFDSFLDIIGHFMFLEKKDEKIDDGAGGHKYVTRETMVFPRYHQLDATRKLIADSEVDGAGRNYLIQHSAGSGKTNSISWLSHRLASLHNAKDQKVFDCVVVITDRRVLDQQLQDAIYQIEHAQGVVKAIDQDSKQLAGALVDGTKIVITTLQKFPFVLRGLLAAAGAESQDKATPEERRKAKEWEDEIARRRYAVIVDEAHSSQSGDSAKELKAILGAGMMSAPIGDGGDEEKAEPDWEDRLNEVMQSRGRQGNLSFFAFTATPKGKTLELFGRKKTTSGLPEAHHLYSMRQAIEEGFICDVVRNYTTYKVYYNVAKQIEDDPTIPKKKGARAIAKFASLHEHNIEQKTEVIIEHFRSKVRNHLAGRAKAMVVTSSRLHAVRFKKAFDRYVNGNGYSDIRTLVAFSGTVTDPTDGSVNTEVGMNPDCISGKPIGEKALPERFASPDYQILLVANKYQTGFDQPLLLAMYVDKRLDGVQAVQTLSRLNRMVPGKENPFVLDFVNEAEDIYKAFKPYFDTTGLKQASDPQQLEVLKHDLDAMQVYFWSEVESFAKVFYKPLTQQVPADHAKLTGFIQPAKDRFNALPDDQKRDDFREKLNSFVNLYSFLSQIIPYGDADLEMLYSFGRMLAANLPRQGETERVKIGDEVGLQYYRLQRISSGEINLREGDPEPVKSPTDVGTGKAKDEKVPLSEIIKVLNDRFGTEFTEEDRLFFEQIRQKAIHNEQVIKLRHANPFDKFQLGLKQLLEDLMVQRMSENDQIVTRYMDDKEFGAAAFALLSRAIFESIPVR